jgi:hypothetical protein
LTTVLTKCSLGKTSTILPKNPKRQNSKSQRNPKGGSLNGENRAGIEDFGFQIFFGVWTIGLCDLPAPAKAPGHCGKLQSFYRKIPNAKTPNHKETPKSGSLNGGNRARIEEFGFQIFFGV